ncbi:Protein of unknown function [Caminicella sporogenes DSM 14501]|uniref:Putative Se/S carrier protein-like domain-containing protein n=1 Tax=Caminicella sporogenes DSM 14501 TaxID=1121266 RepID=A0A1M6NX06_9FIRM|nr:DUF3343 domain-containing protein [Caminicella sporogenes]RKD21612.1 hypothetical protein BET04_07790 [Caminicella sporogenes]SHK00277.1 Protein of unknown function [Caminicella sporogenes DSM 14501]
MKEYIALFYTHSGAIKFNRFCNQNHLECELMPVPRKLSSNCGICAKFKYDKNIENLINDDIEKIYECKSSREYSLVYENEDF